MELILKQGLPHQEKGVKAISQIFEANDFFKNSFYYANPTFDLNKDILLDRIKTVQKQNGVHPEYSHFNAVSDYLNLDIKMETGTGKTYVHTAAIYELHKQFKINKFIVVVPTLAIKAGTKQFIQDSYTKKHFKDVCGYGTEIELQVLEAVKKKKGKQYFPSAVREFVTGSSQNTNKIYVLLTNMALFTNSTMLKDDKNDFGVEGFYKPVDALKATKPFLIIDEPHRFSREQKTFEFIVNDIQPQCIIRFGATFPIATIGKGKTKKSVRDYQNLLYDLNAYEAFNHNLIKGIAKEHFEPLSKKEDKVKIMSVENKASVKFNYIQKDKTKVFELKKGDSLSLISSEFEGIIIEGIGADYIDLSNGQKKSKGEEFSTDIYSSSYQEQMLKLAIDRHFETERINFERKFKIKTLALFFIDDIHSYRVDDKSEKEPYLKNTFERLLSDKINQILLILSDNESEYKEYLEASKKNISSCHAGYFSQDNSTSDEEIVNEVNEILFDKKKLLTIKTEEGKYNTRRFLFSKWTLKEGWDNPNVFTITKLRSSGSDNSKIQEVGRGLRLPVDENGNRISNEEFKLNYIIDFTEADFADKLVKEINDELPKGFIITEERLVEVAKKLLLEPDDLYTDLLIKKYIDRNKNIIIENAIKFFEEYPDFSTGLNSNKIVDRNSKPDKKIKIRPAVYSELKTLWEAISQKYLLFYDRVEDQEYLKDEVVKIFTNDVFADVIITSSRQEVNASDDNLMVANESNGMQYIINKPISYSEFLKKICKQTNLPIKMLNQALLEYAKKNKTIIKINEFSAANFVNKFKEWKINNLQGRFFYNKANIKLNTTVLTYENGSPRNEITQGRIGTKFIEGSPVEKYLYDTYAYDSPLEKDNILNQVHEVVVYGKIPRSSISIPTITGQSYSPDFMYVVKNLDGSKTLNVIVETKSVENQSSLRQIEQVKVNCAKIFFKQLTIDGYSVEFHEQINNKKVKQIIEEVLTASMNGE